MRRSRKPFGLRVTGVRIPPPPPENLRTPSNGGLFVSRGCSGGIRTREGARRQWRLAGRGRSPRSGGPAQRGRGIPPPPPENLRTPSNGGLFVSRGCSGGIRTREGARRQWRLAGRGRSPRSGGPAQRGRGIPPPPPEITRTPSDGGLFVFGEGPVPVSPARTVVGFARDCPGGWHSGNAPDGGPRPRPPSLCHPLAQPWGSRATVPAGGTVETLPTGDPASGPRPCVTHSHSCGVRGSHVSRQAEPRATILIGWNADTAETGAVPCNSKGSFTSMRTISAEAGGC